MGLMETLFGSGAKQQQQAQQQQQQHQQQQQINPHAANNPTIPNAGNTPPAELGPDGKPVNQNPNTPADPFASLWQNDPNQKPNPATAPLINFDQKVLAENVRKMDFAKQIDPNLFQEVLGDDKAAAAQALMQIVNSIGQQSVAQGLIGNSQISEAAIKQYGNTIRGEIPDLIKSATLRDGMRQLNPALTDPAYEPIVGAIQERVRIKFPNATPTELQEMTSKYLDSFAEGINKPKEQQQQQQRQQQNKEQDWDAFVGMPTSLDQM